MSRSSFTVFAILWMTLFARDSRADGAFQLLHIFQSGGVEPRLPACTLLEGDDGFFYGTSVSGGAANRGTVFKFRPDVGVTVIASFAGTNGSAPLGGLTRGPDGNLYGVTGNGGLGFYDDGTVFRITTGGQLETIANFYYTNGAQPTGPLVCGPDERMYGTAAAGPGHNNLGEVFQVTTNGVLTVLHSFTGFDGGLPYSGLTLGPDGALYGTTLLGGESDGSFDPHGTAFRITTNGEFSVLAVFDGTNYSGSSGLSSDPLGGFVGTTVGGGAAGFGTIFHLGTNGELRTLHSFDGADAAGAGSGVIRGADGALYGTTGSGLNTGATNDPAGSIFRLSREGDISILLRFDGTNGLRPFSGMTLGRDGFLYGATADTGNESPFNGGTLYRVAQTPQMNSVGLSEGNVKVRWRSFTRGAYQIQSKPTLDSVEWSPVGVPVPASDPLTEAVFPVADPRQMFLRVVWIP
jgi:uncharacterized repeat protein (TIGR03803 family)